MSNELVKGYNKTKLIISDFIALQISENMVKLDKGQICIVGTLSTYAYFNPPKKSNNQFI
jgi:hypothetical protein